MHIHSRTCYIFCPFSWLCCVDHVFACSPGFVSVFRRINVTMTFFGLAGRVWNVALFEVADGNRKNPERVRYFEAVIPLVLLLKMSATSLSFANNLFVYCMSMNGSVSPVNGGHDSGQQVNINHLLGSQLAGTVSNVSVAPADAGYSNLLITFPRIWETFVEIRWEKELYDGLAYTRFELLLSDRASGFVVQKLFTREQCTYRLHGLSPGIDQYACFLFLFNG